MQSAFSHSITSHGVCYLTKPLNVVPVSTTSTSVAVECWFHKTLQEVFYVYVNSSCVPIIRNAATIFTRCSTFQFHFSRRCLFFVLYCNICSLVNYFFRLSDTLQGTHRHTLDAQLILPPKKAHCKTGCRELTPRLLAVLTLTPFHCRHFYYISHKTYHNYPTNSAEISSSHLILWLPQHGKHIDTL
jgi:hypothetical protein